MKKSKTKKLEIWEHVGGGCMLGDSGKYSCDDIYENAKTKKEIVVLSTKEAHLKMPKVVSGLSELLKIKGVSKTGK